MQPDEPSTGVLLFAHGSSVREANEGVEALAREIEKLGVYRFVRAAFLEQAEPSLAAAVALAVRAGLGRVVVIPYFLTLGIHLRRDLPKLVAAEKAKHPGLEIEVGQSLESHPLMPSIVLGRIQEALGQTKAAR